MFETFLRHFGYLIEGKDWDDGKIDIPSFGSHDTKQCAHQQSV